MDEKSLKNTLSKLLALPKESEWVEFKEAKTSFDFNKIGKYFSALSNEANLQNKNYGWLVFGVNRNHKIIGTEFRPIRTKLDSLKPEIAQHTTSQITFIDIYELSLSGKRVVMFQIPAAPKGIPVAWKGHYYGRNDDELSPLNIQEIEQIRNQVKHEDWSAQICQEATIKDLNTKAILRARKEYKQKNPNLSNDIEQWDNTTFLNKAKVTINGKITNTAIILLGKTESEHFISPSVAKTTWILRNEQNQTKDYEHFGPPFILNSESVFAKIRNLKYRYLPDDTLFPTEINQYEPYVIREALHNCIAHQDYELNDSIIVEEKSDELSFINAGDFIPGSVEKVIQQNFPQKHRNKFLADAMHNLGMIDIIGSGIIRMFTIQKERFFPMPDYDLANPNKVKVNIFGKVLDENYTRLLIKNKDMDLSTVVLLDKVQRNVRLSKNEHKFLKSKGLVEGRYPNLFVSSHIAAATKEKTKYIKNRGFDKKYYQDLIVEFIKKNGSASRREVNDLILSKLPEILTVKQKEIKINNLLSEMRRDLSLIKNTGSTSKPKWVLSSR